MANTIERALRSVLDQLDDSFEVIVVDDGSKDQSVSILRRLEKEYPNLSVFELERNRNRTLAQTRNISISYARGEYLILHIDCDDYWHPYIKDFVLVYHQIEKFKGPNFLLSGQQINMGNAQFLRSHGPYQNGHMVEDSSEMSFEVEEGLKAYLSISLVERTQHRESIDCLKYSYYPLHGLMRS